MISNKPTITQMKQTRIFFLLALLISTVAVSGHARSERPADSPADIRLRATRQTRFRERISAESLLHGQRLAHRRLRFRMGRLGASVVEGAATDRKVDARLQL